MATFGAEEIRHALEVARGNGFAEVELGAGDSAFRAVLEPVKRKRPAAASSDGGGTGEVPLLSIKAPLVGYYADGKVPLIPGATVKKGDVVAVVTALGLANDVESSVAGEIVEVFVQPGDAVQYGQVIASVRS